MHELERAAHAVRAAARQDDAAGVTEAMFAGGFLAGLDKALGRATPAGLAAAAPMLAGAALILAAHGNRDLRI